jgi:hypothetical protein
MKLETKHLAPYLPYKLKMVMTHDSFEDFENIDSDEDCLLKGSIWELYVLTTDYIDFFGGECDDFAVKGERYRIANNGTLKPILRPLSDLTLEECTKCDILNVTSALSGQKPEFILRHTSYIDIEKLISLHFDVFGLIEKGLAIDINTL